MDVTTAQLYDLLVEKGFEKDRVREALSGVATLKEVETKLASVDERIDANFAKFETRMYRALLIQTAAIAAIVLGMLQFAT